MVKDLEFRNVSAQRFLLLMFLGHEPLGRATGRLLLFLCYVFPKFIIMRNYGCILDSIAATDSAEYRSPF